jgi:Tol biopolymer transport system component
MTLIARHRRVLMGIGALTAALGIVAPAQATFPGDNGRIAYTWSRGGEAFEDGPRPQLVGIVSVRRDGLGRRLVARGGTQPSYSPDGRRIAFLRSQNRLWVARADGERARPVTPREWRVGEHTWSPGGTRIAFERNFVNSGASALYTVMPDGTGIQRLLKAPGIELSDGAWSPNGKAIVYDQPSVTGRTLVRIFRAGQITTLARPAFDASWSSRGLIAYTTAPAGGQLNQVCVTRPDPAATRRCIGFADASVSDPTWSPDGRRLMVMYTPQGGGQAEIWIVRPDGTVLTRAPRGSVFPIWSPDGSRLAFSEARFAGEPSLEYEDLWVMHLDGSVKRRVVRGGQVNSPDWQPRP